MFWTTRPPSLFYKNTHCAVRGGRKNKVARSEHQSRPFKCSQVEVRGGETGCHVASLSCCSPPLISADSIYNIYNLK